MNSKKHVRQSASLISDMVFVSLEGWDEIWRRNQFVCAELLKRDPQMRILFVSPPRDVSNALRTTRWKALRSKGIAPAEFAGRLDFYRTLKLLPNTFVFGRAINEWLARRQIAAEVKKMALSRPLLWINAHEYGHLAGRLGEKAVIYDITDDWTELKQPAYAASLTRRQDAALCQKADAVIVCSERLAELKRPMCSELHLIPNGVDSDHYRRVLDGSGALPAECAKWARPVFGYTGTIHPDRLDLELLENVANRLAKGSIVMLGPNHLTPDQIARLRACGNVYLPGPIPYARIPEFMRAFDVCIVPHRVTAFTESLNPIKLWEYLAAGKPIASTNVAGFKGYPEFVYLASDAEQFAAAMQMALRENPMLPDARRTEAAKHSWKDRVRQIEGVLAPFMKGPHLEDREVPICNH